MSNSRMLESTRSGHKYSLGREFRIGRRMAHEARRVSDGPEDQERYWVKLVPADDPAAIARLRYEAVMLEKLNHSALIRMVDRGRNSGYFFLVLDQAAGQPLRDLVGSRPLPMPRTLAIAVQLAELLEYLHGRRIICRTLPPESIYVDTQGNIKLIDLSAAWDEISPTNSGGTIEQALYISPEQAGGAKAERASDIYVFGVLLFELLTGRPLFQEPHRSNLVLQHILESAPDVRTIQPDVPPDLAEIAGRCLAKDMGNRYIDAPALLGALQSVNRPGLQKSQPERGSLLGRFRASLDREQKQPGKGKK